MDGILPVGSVVLLKNSTKKLMIIGVCQFQSVQGQKKPKIWDYAGCIWPEGYQGANDNYLFNRDQIETIFSIGYQDQEQMVMKTKYDMLLEQLRKEAAEETEE